MSKRHVYTFGLAWLVVLSVTASATDAPLPDPLRPPFDVASVRAAHGSLVGESSCEAPPLPQVDLLFGGFYTSGTGSSIVDEVALESYRTAAEPVRDFAKGLVTLGDRYVASRPAAAPVARCALDWLAAWAGTGAFLGRMSSQGGFVRKWALGVAATAFLKVRDEPSLSVATKSEVKDWLRRWAEAVHHDYSTGTDRSSRRNNHLYWAAWSVMAVAVALNDRDLFGWSVERFRFALSQIEGDGTLPLEMARRSKALHYHLYSIPPLVLIAETGARNGLDLYGERDGALHRLIRRTVASLDDPSFFSQRSGYDQDWVGNLDGGKIAWMEPFYTRFKDPALATWMRRFRPLKSTRQGGNLTVLYGVKDLED